jgi:serine carboxypeptidase-like clade I
MSLRRSPGQQIVQKMINQVCFVLWCWLTAVALAAESLCENEAWIEDRPDRVYSLPGWNQPIPGLWFSGYVHYEFQGHTIHTHYMLATDEDIGGKSSPKPVIYWSNGGPGASSLFGFLTELGPLWLNDKSLETDDYRQTGIPSLLYSSTGWTRLGHVLVIDQPAPVGFSYCDNITDSSLSCSGIAWTDELAAENARLALEQILLVKFPCILANEMLYLTGESYAGIYIPTLAREILHNSPDALSSKLAGWAVGDGCLGTHTDLCGNINRALSPRRTKDSDDYDDFDFWYFMFLAGHGQIPMQTFSLLLRACRNPGLDWLNIKQAVPDSAACKKALREASRQMGGVYAYGLYDDCTYRNGLVMQKLSAHGDPIALASALRTRRPARIPVITGATNDYACGSDIVMSYYLSLPQVRDALHVKSDFFAVDNAEGFDYTPTEADLRVFYSKVVRQESKPNGSPYPKLKIMIYNGDTDPAITSLAAQNWTSRMAFDEVEEWRPWTVDSCRRMGGYVTRYVSPNLLSNLTTFDFVTIRGAGHMVPTYKPDAAFVMIKAWLNSEDFPVFDPDCQYPWENLAQSAAA